MWKIVVLPCVVITSLETGAFEAIIACIDMLMLRRNPARSRRKEVTQGAVAILRQKKVQGCVSQNSDPKKSILW